MQVHGDKLYFESSNKELFNLLENENTWDICMTINLHGFLMMKRALKLAERIDLINTTLFPSCASKNMTSKCEDLKFLNPAIAKNPAQADAVEAIVTRRSGLAPVCF